MVVFVHLRLLNQVSVEAVVIRDVLVAHKNVFEWAVCKVLLTNLLSVAIVYGPCDSDIPSKKHDFANRLELGTHLVTLC